ncbi:hypothetical protein O7632_24855 [Solwaraspora sp. WMMD406]|uniref:DUF7586 domain-containing protein n=1 Tax=Solwaraspora sp. WMMD406 TaxID=3016095 RepID=UPI002416C709|nr:hypothetical protein [Solwaraspora sp. WMMD406]MDG4767296.1 hypothetical protein [Solwaraspora sp. WMMD406]
MALRLLGDGTLRLTPIGTAGRGTRFRATPTDTWYGFDGFYAGETLRVRGRDRCDQPSGSRHPGVDPRAVPTGVCGARWGRSGRLADRDRTPVMGTDRQVSGSAG